MTAHQDLINATASDLIARLRTEEITPLDLLDALGSADQRGRPGP